MKKGIAHYRVGDAFEGFLLIKEARKGMASNGKPFLTLIFTDQTGDIEAKFWDVSQEDEQVYRAETIVFVSGQIQEYRGRLQFRIKTIRPASERDNISLTQLLERAPVDKEVLFETLTKTVFEMENPNIQRIVRAFIQKYKGDLLIYPAATSNHHAYVSGLLHHIVSMLQIAKSLCRIYPEINKDLLYAGVILHDIGKINELSGAVSTTYTTKGTLLGHISMMASEIEQVAKELNIDGEEVVVLQHLVLSHHGKGEWGSPKPPLVREAELLHFIDLIDAKMNILNRALKTVEPGEFTERLFPMDNRAFYKPIFEK